MKRIKLTTMVAAALTAVAALLPTSAVAYDFAVDGIYYDVKNGEAVVTYRAENTASYTGQVVIPETVTYGGKSYPVTAIGKGAFDYCSLLTEVTLPNSIDSISSFAFQRCPSLKSIVIPNSVTTIGNCAFWRSGVERAVIGNGVEVLGDYCFQYCYGLKELVLGSSVKMLNIKAFFDCPALKSVTCLAPEPPGMYAYYSFCDEAYANATLNVPGASLPAYKTDPNWGKFRSFNNLTPAEQLTLDKTSMTMFLYNYQQLTATVLPGDASSALLWSSSNPDVATVSDNGYVYGAAPGVTTITVATTDGSNLTASCAVRVLGEGVQADNSLMLPATITVEKGKPFELPVRMVNSAPVTALQCDVELPEGFELATDDNGNYLIDLVDSRVASGHQLHARQLSPGVVRVVVTSMQSQAFIGNDGDVMILRLNLAEGVEDGEYDVILSHVVLADAAAVTYYGPDAASTVVVKSYMRGDANGDGTVNVGDYVTIANYILNLEPDPFIHSAADVDESGTIDVGDLVGVANIVLGDFVMPDNAPHHDVKVTLSGESRPLDQNRHAVTLNLDNDVALAAMQLDVNLPEGMTLASASLSSRASRHSLSVSELPDGNHRLLASSTMNDVMDGHEGALLTLVLEGPAADDAALTVSDAVLAEADMTTHAVSPFSVSIGNSAVKELCGDTRIYSRDGNIIVETTADTDVEFIAPNGMIRMDKAHAGINTYPAQRGICIVRAAGQVAKLNVQ
jgi:hypothetical protein